MDNNKEIKVGSVLLATYKENCLSDDLVETRLLQVTEAKGCSSPYLCVDPEDLNAYLTGSGYYRTKSYSREDIAPITAPLTCPLCGNKIRVCTNLGNSDSPVIVRCRSRTCNTVFQTSKENIGGDINELLKLYATLWHYNKPTE